MGNETRVRRIRNSINKVPKYKNHGLPGRHLHNPLSRQRVRTEQELAWNRVTQRRNVHNTRKDAKQSLATCRSDDAGRRTGRPECSAAGAAVGSAAGTGYVPQLPEGSEHLVCAAQGPAVVQHRSAAAGGEADGAFVHCPHHAA